MWYVYVHFKPNGLPFYVGKGLKPRAYSIKRPHNQRHTRTLDKYGVSNIKVFRMPLQTHEEAIALEVSLISSMRERGFPLVNMTEGGDGTPGFKRTPEQCAANGLRKIGNKNMVGKTLSAEARAKISKANKGRKRGEAFAQKRREAMIAYFSNPENRKRRSETSSKMRHSTETKEKLKRIKRGMKWITNGTEDKQLFGGAEIPAGWRRGRTWRKSANKRRQA